MVATLARTSDVASVARRASVVPRSCVGVLLVGYSALTGFARVPFSVGSGLLFTAPYLWRRSLCPGMVLHALLNLDPLSA